MANAGKSAPIFKIKKKNLWRDKALRFVGLFLIGLVIFGTFIWLSNLTNFSLSTFFQNIGNRIRPEIKQEEKIEELTMEEELKNLINQEKIVEIESVSKTAEKDILLKTRQGLVIIFSAKKSLTDQVTTLQTLLTKAKIENKALKKVDFRFEKIIVEY